MSLNPDSPLVGAVHVSPNFEPRKTKSGQPDMLLIHYTGMTSAEKAITWLAAPESKVSCHYVVDEAGQITQMVAESARAWHAGVAWWAGEEDINSASIGIEVANPGHEAGYPAFPDAQMTAVAALAGDICARRRIAPARVLAHSDVAPIRKIDPGEKFNWRLLAEHGAGLWVAPEPYDRSDEGLMRWHIGDAVVELQRLLRALGYKLQINEEFDMATEAAVVAFQRHWRQEKVNGKADRSTVLTLERVLAAATGQPIA